eukprot:CAMPEP_0194118672 /NCGR_PEP_ID=MMETSP0150-20130528/36562_1 /TAXON_ID=122233 /ORGANISM="Chaetoceros debilis, Strain MM31A-1" /LENGTH=415 /DNA_ID=CAMNT_0038810137 /DNA_START=35 /DNA_END=1282 /DNA_ORIENTATION=+
MNSTAAADVPLGMMDGAYFTSRKDLLDFFNSLLSMNLTKIEQTATGAVACQLMDYMYPGSIPMKRVNWAAKSDFQYIENYKLLQIAFTKTRVQKHVDVDKLIRAKYQDNLEFCQWLKAFFEHATSAVRDDYDAIARRSIGKGGKNLDDIFKPRGRGSMSMSKMKKGNGNGNGNNSARSGSMSGSSRSVVSSNRSVTSTSRRPNSSSASYSSVRSSVGVLKENNSRSRANPSRNTINAGHHHVRKPSMSVSASTLAAATSKLEQEKEELTKKNATLRRNNAEIEVTLENIESERDFYFDKLRGIEVMMQVHEEENEKNNDNDNDNKDGSRRSDPEALIKRIFKVLYAKLDDNLVVTDDGELLEGIGSDEDLLNETGMSAGSDNIGKAAEDCQYESLVSAEDMMVVDDLNTSAMSEF